MGRLTSGNWSSREEKGVGETDRQREKKDQTEKERNRWEVGRALLKENVVNVRRRCSWWLQLRTHPVRTPRAGQYRCLNTNSTTPHD